MSKLYIPRQVINGLIKYHSDGCMLEVQDDVFNGTPIRRYIANGNLVLWTEQLLSLPEGSKEKHMNDELREQLDTWWSDWNAQAMPTRPAEKLLATIQAHTDKAVKEARLETINEVIAAIEPNQHGQFEDDGGHIAWYLDDLLNRLKELQEGKE